MNGIIFMEVEKFSKTILDEQAWQEVVRLANVPYRLYVPVADYPDEEAIALLNALSAKMGEPVPAILETLGEFIVPDLIKMTPYWIKPDWKTLDLIANTEEAIHQMIRNVKAHINPPRLQCRRTSSQEVIVTYTSSRKMCALAKGIVKGVAKHYGEDVTITEPTCMLKGAAMCQLIITVI